MRIGLLLVAFGVACAPAPQDQVRIGSKKFTESVVLGELATQLARSTGANAVHRRELGGTRVLWEALRRGDLDVYPEYTGTIARELVRRPELTDIESLRGALEADGLRLGPPLGFDDTYAIGVPRALAEKLGLEKLSDLAAHPDLRFGFSEEFMNREDGWPVVRDRYGLRQRQVRGIDHDLAYGALQSGAIDATDLYSTDAEVRAWDLRVLEDDRHVFPAYQAVFVWRIDLESRAPEVVAALSRLGGRIDAATMQTLNARAKLEHVPESQVAAEFLSERFGLMASVPADTLWTRLRERTAEHLALVLTSLIAAILAAIPLGVVAARRPRAGQVILAVTGVVQTIPSLALLVFMIPLLGIGARPAMAALFLYSLLPIVRNTHAGLTTIAPDLLESAASLGISRFARLRLIELPLASPAILAGIQTSAVINVGAATLGALIGAGGYGQPILTGIRLDDVGLILEGAVPAALMAIAAQLAFQGLARVVVPRGLRLARTARN